jgi:hypothetical protein
MSEHKQSPFNWYLGTYVVGFNLVDVDHAHDLHEQYDGWEVSVMVKADSCEQAYDKIVQAAKRDTRHYVGELDGTSVDWEFKGVTELDPIFTEVNEVSDVVYVEHDQVRVRDQEYLVCKKRDFN